MHDIGKSLVALLLEGRGIHTHDLGQGASPGDFTSYVEQNPQCKLVLISVFRTEALGSVHDVVSALERAQLNRNIFIMIGGAAASREFAEQIGADAYTESAEDAAAKAHELLSL